MTQAFNRDCIEAMREFPDKFFDLAVVDPPYGGAARESCKVNVLNGTEETAHGSEDALSTIISAVRTGGTWSRKYQSEPPGRRISAIGILLRRKNTFKNLRG